MAELILTNTRDHDIRLNYQAGPQTEITTINLPSVKMEQVTSKDGIPSSKRVTVPVKVDSALVDALKKKDDKVFQKMLDEGYILVGEGSKPVEKK